jgi:gamma-glutamylcyclotransferase (GGCT)/AIG2-like uncharacterized protein YtfP
VSFGMVPGLIDMGADHASAGPTVGELYSVNGPTFRRLDSLEGHPDLYRRSLVRVDCETPGAPRNAWVYLYKASRVYGTDTIVANNDWRKHYEREIAPELAWRRRIIDELERSGATNSTFTDHSKGTPSGGYWSRSSRASSKQWSGTGQWKKCDDGIERWVYDNPKPQDVKPVEPYALVTDTAPEYESEELIPLSNDELEQQIRELEDAGIAAMDDYESYAEWFRKNAAPASSDDSRDVNDDWL